MAVQVSSLYRQGVVRPLDGNARNSLASYFIAAPIRCEWLPILGDATFGAIWDSGLLQEIGNACGVRITDYEEIEIPPDQVLIAGDAVAVFMKNEISGPVRDFAIALHSLLVDAAQAKMPVYFIL